MALKEVKFTALIIESERGWGQRVDEVKEFDTEKERDEFIKEFNKDLCKEAFAPDCYMRAEAGGTLIREPKNA